MNVSVLKFQNTQFDITDIHGQPWLRGLQVASALDYNRANPRQADFFIACRTLSGYDGYTTRHTADNKRPESAVFLYLYET